MPAFPPRPVQAKGRKRFGGGGKRGGESDACHRPSRAPLSSSTEEGKGLQVRKGGRGGRKDMDCPFTLLPLRKNKGGEGKGGGERPHPREKKRRESTRPFSSLVIVQRCKKSQGKKKRSPSCSADSHWYCFGRMTVREKEKEGCRREEEGRRLASHCWCSSVSSSLIVAWMAGEGLEKGGGEKGVLGLGLVGDRGRGLTEGKGGSPPAGSFLLLTLVITERRRSGEGGEGSLGRRSFLWP